MRIRPYPHLPLSGLLPGRIIKGILGYWDDKSRTPRSTRKRRALIARKSRRRNR